MSSKKLCHWVIRVHVVDRAGALTSIASAFSNENINIRTVVGHGKADKTSTEGSIVLTFFCDEKEKDSLIRKIQRLTKVNWLEEYPYGSEELRKSALILVNRQLTPKDVAGDETFLTTELVKKDKNGWTYFLAGSPFELDPVLHQLEDAGCVKDIVYSIIGL